MPEDGGINIRNFEQLGSQLAEAPVCCLVFLHQLCGHILEEQEESEEIYLEEGWYYFHKSESTLITL